MPTAVTVGNKVVEEINQILADLRSYLPEGDLRVVRLLSEADKLIKVDPAEGHSMKGSVYSLTGNLEKATYHSKNAIKLKSHPVYLLNMCAVLTNLGKFTEAQDFYRTFARPRDGLFVQTFGLGISCGAFQLMREFMGEAQNLKLEIPGDKTELIARSAQLLREQDVSDSLFASFLDVAGGIMREQRVVFYGTPSVFVWELEDRVMLSYTFELPCDALKTEDLDTELSIRLLDQCPDYPNCLSITFRSGLPSNERYGERNIAAGA